MRISEMFCIVLAAFVAVSLIFKGNEHENRITRLESSSVLQVLSGMPEYESLQPRQIPTAGYSGKYRIENVSFGPVTGVEMTSEFEENLVEIAKRLNDLEGRISDLESPKQTVVFNEFDALPSNSSNSAQVAYSYVSVGHPTYAGYGSTGYGNSALFSGNFRPVQTSLGWTQQAVQGGVDFSRQAVQTGRNVSREAVRIGSSPARRLFNRGSSLGRMSCDENGCQIIYN
jgi:hypothetical protein